MSWSKTDLDGIGFESEESRMESPKSSSTLPPVQKSNDVDTDTGTTSYWSDFSIDSSNDDDLQSFGNYFPWVNIGKNR